MYCSLYKADLLQQGARPNDVDRMAERGFAKWFKCHVSLVHGVYMLSKCIIKDM
jgi:hypothetical protein